MQLSGGSKRLPFLTLGDSFSIFMLHKQPSHPLTLYKKCLVTGFHHWVGKIPWKKEWLSTPVFLPGEFYWLRSLAGYRLHSMELWRVGHDWATKAECVHGASGKESAYQYRRHKRRGFDPKVRKVRKIPWGGQGNPLQYSCLCPMDRGAWGATVHSVAKSWTWLT